MYTTANKYNYKAALIAVMRGIFSDYMEIYHALEEQYDVEFTTERLIVYVDNDPVVTYYSNRDIVLHSRYDLQDILEVMNLIVQYNNGNISFGMFSIPFYEGLKFNVHPVHLYSFLMASCDILETSTDPNITGMIAIHNDVWVTVDSDPHSQDALYYNIQKE